MESCIAGKAFHLIYRYCKSRYPNIENIFEKDYGTIDDNKFPFFEVFDYGIKSKDFVC